MPRWRTLSQAAQELGISKRTLTRYIAARKIKSYRVAFDANKYVDLDELEELRKPREIEPEGEK